MAEVIFKNVYKTFGKTTAVNDFSLNLGEQGVAAVEVLMTRAEERGLISKSAEPLFLT